MGEEVEEERELSKSQEVVRRSKLPISRSPFALFEQTSMYFS